MRHSNLPNDSVTLAEKFRREFDDDTQAHLFPEEYAYKRYCQYCRMIGLHNPPSIERWKDIQKDLFGRNTFSAIVRSVNS